MWWVCWLCNWFLCRWMSICACVIPRNVRDIGPIVALDNVWPSVFTLSVAGLCGAWDPLPVKRGAQVIISLSVILNAESTGNVLCLDTVLSVLMGAWSNDRCQDDMFCFLVFFGIVWGEIVRRMAFVVFILVRDGLSFWVMLVVFFVWYLSVSVIVFGCECRWKLSHWDLLALFFWCFALGGCCRLRPCFWFYEVPVVYMQGKLDTLLWLCTGAIL